MPFPEVTFTLAVRPDGKQRISDPDGTGGPQAPEIVDPVANFRVNSVTHNSITLAWDYNDNDHDGFEIHGRVYGGAFAQAAIVGDTRRTATISNGVESSQIYQYRIRATSTTLSNSEWSQIIQVKTLAPPPVSGGQYAPARIPLSMVNPHPDLNPEKSTYSRAHSKMAYRRNVSVKGGKPPFVFSVSGNMGATVEPMSPWWNPKMISAATVHAPANASGFYVITCRDQDGTEVSTRVDVTVQDENFIFFDSAGNSDNPIGTIEQPIQDWSQIWGPAPGKLEAKWKTIVFRDGTHELYGDKKVDDNHTYCAMHADRPMGYIGYPGETATIDLESTQFGFRALSSDSNANTEDLYFDHLNTFKGKCFITMRFIHKRFNASNIGMYLMTMPGPPGGADPAGESNIGGICLTAIAPTTERSMTNIKCVNFTMPEFNPNAGGAINYGFDGAVDIFEMVNCECSEGVYFKKANGRFTVTSFRAWEGSTPSYRLSGFGYGHLDDETMSDVAGQYRYSLYRVPGNDLTNQKPFGYGEDSSPDGSLDYKKRSKRYIDRCVVLSASSPPSPYPYGAKMGFLTDSVVATGRYPGSGMVNEEPHEHVTYTNSDIISPAQIDQYIDMETGKLLDNEGFTKGWEV